MHVRKAGPQDIPAIIKSYELVHDEEEAGRTTIGWVRSIYPVPETARRALDEGTLYAMDDFVEGETRLVASGIINQTQVPEYALAHWTEDTPDDQVLVLHTLVVDPRYKGKGYGSSFVGFYEEEAGKRGCTACRIDTNERNASARRLYARLGYREVSIVPCNFNGIPHIQLVCLEKIL